MNASRSTNTVEVSSYTPDTISAPSRKNNGPSLTTLANVARHDGYELISRLNTFFKVSYWLLA